MAPRHREAGAGSGQRRVCWSAGTPACFPSLPLSSCLKPRALSRRKEVWYFQKGFFSSLRTNRPQLVTIPMGEETGEESGRPCLCLEGGGSGAGSTPAGPPQLSPLFGAAHRVPQKQERPTESSIAGRAAVLTLRGRPRKHDIFQLPSASLSSRDCRRGSRAPRVPTPALARAIHVLQGGPAPPLSHLQNGHRRNVGPTGWLPEGTREAL